jgi:hypothetical protein
MANGWVMTQMIQVHPFRDRANQGFVDDPVNGSVELLIVHLP